MLPLELKACSSLVDLCRRSEGAAGSEVGTGRSATDDELGARSAVGGEVGAESAAGDELGARSTAGDDVGAGSAAEDEVGT